MFAVLFSIFVALVLVGILSGIVMRVRLSKRGRSNDRLAWWRRSEGEVFLKYREEFPGSLLPRFVVLVFWLLIAWAVVGLILSLRKHP